MKKIFFITALFIILNSCGIMKDCRWSRAYENDINKIETWQKGETKKEYTARYERERARLQHKHFHHNEQGAPIACNACELCRAEADEIIARQEAEIKKREEARLAEIKRQEEARKAEEQRREEARQAEIKKMEAEAAEYEKMEQLRLEFVKKNKDKITYDLNTLRNRVKRAEATLKSYEKQSFAELDNLEKQYVGRLDGDCFRIKKDELLEKWERKVHAIDIPTGSEVYSKWLDLFNAYLKENGYEYVFGCFSGYKTMAGKNTFVEVGSLDYNMDLLISKDICTTTATVSVNTCNYTHYRPYI